MALSTPSTSGERSISNFADISSESSSNESVDSDVSFVPSKKQRHILEIKESSLTFDVKVLAESCDRTGV